MGSARFAWKPEYEVGDHTIDGQHRQLLVLANLLYDAVKMGKGEAVIGQAFDALGLYTTKHFDDEDRYFAAIGSLLLVEHRHQHEKLAQELAALREEMLGFLDGIPDTLEHWVETRLIPHMVIDDQKAFHAPPLAAEHPA
ncbi:hemerythrin domain-containing protein [Azospirillum sp.]|uniref:bacteriohemerythrin n=1 Tax=Azospirillum sp. TaxID=34012 RepID=UPI002D504CBA|nr:hemerythrin domain-containing protein [Azospirillum sp.]HYD65497.1 hemerythrin domain-containing protein [Azospirillum sp.]